MYRQRCWPIVTSRIEQTACVRQKIQKNYSSRPRKSPKILPTKEISRLAVFQLVIIFQLRNHDLRSKHSMNWALVRDLLKARPLLVRKWTINTDCALDAMSVTFLPLRALQTIFHVN